MSPRSFAVLLFARIARGDVAMRFAGEHGDLFDCVLKTGHFEVRARVTDQFSLSHFVRGVSVRFSGSR